MNKIKGIMGSLAKPGSSSTSASLHSPAAGKLDELGCDDVLDAAHFSYCKASIFGFPAQPACFAYDPVQRLLAIGTKTGRVRIFGQPGAEACIVHPSSGDDTLAQCNTETASASPSSHAMPLPPAAVVQVLFVVNEGGLITLCADSKLHYWNIRDKQPTLRSSIEFQREIPTHCFHPIQSKWLLVGSSQGNVHVVNMESFTLSGYIIYWNKAVGPAMCSKHPGQVVQLTDSPIDPNKLLIGFETGVITLWDLKAKNTDCKFVVQEGLHSLSWHTDGRYFMSSHTDGSLITWDIKTPNKPAAIEQPHVLSKAASSNAKEYYMPIPKVEWKTAPENEQFVIFSGGTAISRGPRVPSTISLMRGKNLNLLDLQAEVIDFCTICHSPFGNEVQSPLAVAVLLENDLIIFDLQTPSYPPFENPYSMDIHDSEVTFTGLYIDVSPDVVPALYTAGMRQRQNLFSPREWPVKGGQVGQNVGSYCQLIITGHRNGIVKFWDASGIQLQILYLLNVSKLFQTAAEAKKKIQKTASNSKPEESESAKTDDKGENETNLNQLIQNGTFAVTQAKLSDNGESLLVGGVGFAILYRLSETQAETNLVVVEAKFSFNSNGQGGETGSVSDSGQPQASPRPNAVPPPGGFGQQSAGPQGCYLRQGIKKWNAGFQPDLAVVVGWLNATGDIPSQPPAVTCLDLHDDNEVIFVGTTCGVVVVDCVQKAAVMKLTTPEIFACIDPVALKAVAKKLKDQRAAAEVSDDDSESGQAKTPIQDYRTLLAPQGGSSRSYLSVEPEQPSKERRASFGNTDTLELDESAMKRKSSFPQVMGSRNSMAPHEDEVEVGRDDSIEDENDEDDESELPPMKLTGKATRKMSVFQRLSNAFTGSHHGPRQTRLSVAVGRTQDVPDASSLRRFSAVVPANTPSPSVDFSDLFNNDLSTNVIDLRDSFSESFGAVSIGQDSPSDGFFDSKLVSPNDVITCSTFADSFPTKIKPDIKNPQPPQPSPTLWIGTQGGALFVVSISLPSDEERLSSPVIASVSQSVYQMNGPVLTVAILPMSDFITSKPSLASVNELDSSKSTSKQRHRPASTTATSPTYLPVDSNAMMVAYGAIQLAVLVSRDQLLTITLPSQVVASRARPSSPYEGTARRHLYRASIIKPREAHSHYCVACVSTDGQVSVFSLPRLRPLFEVDQCCDPVTPRSLNTFRFSHYGHAIFFDSPSELNKMCFWADTNDKMDLSQGSLYVETAMPERPKTSFLKSLFNTASKDTALAERDELFGDPSLKPSVNVAKPVSNKLQQLQAEVSQAQSSNSPYGRMLEGAKERGEKLGELDERTQRMMLGAQEMAKNAAALAEQQKNKKWYNPFS